MAKANGGSGCCMENGNGGCSKPADGEKRAPPPGLKDYNPDTELIFPPTLHKYQFKPLAFGNKRKRWYRPTTLQQLLQIKNVYPSAKLIGGSTETQIETKFKGMNYSASVYVGDIAELRQYQFHDDYVEIGGNIALTDLETVAKEALTKYGDIRGQPFAAILKQLRYFAGRQIRNVGTPAGNLATASPISDLNPVFVASNSVIIAKSLDKEVELPMTDFFKGYRTTTLPNDAIIASIRIPVFKPEGEYLNAFKQSKRKDDDIAIVTAALRVSLSPSFEVEDSWFAYGGMAPMTVVAQKTREFLRGRRWDNHETVEGVMNALDQDFNLRFGVPGGMATYRKSLAMGFFYKFYHETLAKIQSKSTDIDHQAIGEIERIISTGQKDHSVALKYEQKILGKEAPHVSAMKQCTGEAQYIDDMPVQQNELYGCMVLSTKAHAKIISIDTSVALDLPGVVDYVNREDLVDKKANWWGAPNCDETFFAEGEVFTAGQPIGLIVAKTAKQAEAGMRAVKIEYEDLPAILTIEEAVQAESFFEHFRYINKGDAEKAFETADHVFTGVARMGGQEHFYLETNACLAIPKPEDGEMEIWSSTQNPSET